MTMRWPNHVFSFMLAVSIVNVQNAALYFLNKAKVDVFAIMMTHSKAAYIQPLLAGGRDNKESRKTWVIGEQPHHGASIPKLFSRATAEVQDKIWQMEMH